MKPGQQDRQDVANAGVNTNTPGVIVTGVGNVGSDICGQNHVGSQVGSEDPAACQMDMDLSKSEGTQAGGGLHQSVGTCTSSKGTGTRNKDFGDDMVSLWPKQNLNQQQLELLTDACQARFHFNKMGVNVTVFMRITV